MARESVSPLLQTVVTAVLWGTSFPVVDYGLKSGVDPGTFVSLRFVMAAPMMIVGLMVFGRMPLELLRNKWVWTLGGLNAVGFACQFFGQRYTDASVAALLVNLSVVLAAAGGAAFLGERLGRSKVIGVVLAVTGTTLIATNGNLGGLAYGQYIGDALYLVAAVSWGGYIVYAKKVSDERNADPASLAAAVVAASAVLLAPLGVTASFAIPSGEGLAAIAYTAVLNTAVPFILYQRGLKHLSAGTSALILMLEIVVAVGISAAFLGESLTEYAWVGAAAVLVSILLVSGVEVRGKSLSVGEGGAQASEGTPSVGSDEV
ncbi:MAG: DMT family transporter [Thaumarchaeota archaeon]|nr:DMT family transporter [Nitrososphaerota archaeon]